MTATFDDEVVAIAAEDDDNEPTTVPSAAVPELLTPECLFDTAVAPPFPALRLPPVDGLSPSIQTRCCRQKPIIYTQIFLNLIYKTTKYAQMNYIKEMDHILNYL
jgi:hypothetical protein